MTNAQIVTANIICKAMGDAPGYLAINEREVEVNHVTYHDTIINQGPFHHD